jgi:hypothetical protein
MSGYANNFTNNYSRGARLLTKSPEIVVIFLVIKIQNLIVIVKNFTQASSHHSKHGVLVVLGIKNYEKRRFFF